MLRSSSFDAATRRVLDARALGDEVWAVSVDVQSMPQGGNPVLELERLAPSGERIGARALGSAIPTRVSLAVDETLDRRALYADGINFGVLETFDRAGARLEWRALQGSVQGEGFFGVTLAANDQGFTLIQSAATPHGGIALVQFGLRGELPTAASRSLDDDPLVLPWQRHLLAGRSFAAVTRALGPDTAPRVLRVRVFDEHGVALGPSQVLRSAVAGVVDDAFVLDVGVELTALWSESVDATQGRSALRIRALDALGAPRVAAHTVEGFPGPHGAIWAAASHGSVVVVHVGDAVTRFAVFAPDGTQRVAATEFSSPVSTTSPRAVRVVTTRDGVLALVDGPVGIVATPIRCAP